MVLLLYNGFNTCMIFDEATCSFALTPLVVKSKLQRCDIEGVRCDRENVKVN